jgi:sigma-B regulation protein RsbU (phosphoserine phosphatase)
VTSRLNLREDSAEQLLEEAPCGYLSTTLDGTIIKVNRTFERWTGFAREELLRSVRFRDLLSPGGRIYYETHFAPLLRMQGGVEAIALDIVRADGSRLPALINSVVGADADGEPRVVRTTIFDVTDRRRYENELLSARHREQQIARQLQSSLLSGEIPTSATVDLKHLYFPGVQGTQAGGDWYDAFWIDEPQVLGLVVGDVVGRGIAAAATMGQLRSAVRALAATGLRPAGLLEALDSYSHRHAVGQMTTIVYAELDLGTRTLRFACAGHPPPLVASAAGGSEFLWGGRSSPINAFNDRVRRREDTRTLAMGSTVLLYTDGVIEDRRRSLDAGLQQLQATVAVAASDQPLAELLQSLAGPQQVGHADDICLLGARLIG